MLVCVEMMASNAAVRSLDEDELEGGDTLLAVDGGLKLDAIGAWDAFEAVVVEATPVVAAADVAAVDDGLVEDGTVEAAGG